MKIHIPNSLFVENRERFKAQMKPNSIAIFFSNDQMPKNADAHYDYRQNSDLFWLTGIEQEETILVLYPDCPKEEGKEVLFLRKTSELIKIWEGHKYTIEEAQERSGISSIKWNNTYDGFVQGLIYMAENIYLNANEHGRFTTEVPYKDIRAIRDLQHRYPLHNYERSAPILHELRAIKSQAEINVIQQACNITEKGFRRILGFVKPGVWEYEVEAEIIHEFLMNRSSGPAYDSIIAGGENACILHYVDNDQQLQDGDLLLMDFGADFGYYASDMTRTIPVNGRFTDRQKDVYSAVLRIMKYATGLLRPGIFLKDYEREVGEYAAREMVDLKLLTQQEIDEAPESRPAHKKYFMHGTSHFLGIDVHDVGLHHKPIEKNMVFTVEPGIYIPDERIGVRLENNVVVTDNAPMDLMANIPIEIEEIEQLMNE